MKVFKIFWKDGSQYAGTVTDADWRMISDYKYGQLQQPYPKPPMEMIRFSRRGRPYKETDFPFTGGELVLKGRAMRAMGEWLTGYGEFLELACPDEELWLFKCTNVLDVIDQTKTEIRPTGAGGYFPFRDPEFLSEVVDDHQVFRPVQDYRPLVQQEFIDRYNAAELKGLVFEMLWSPETGTIKGHWKG